MEHFLKTYFFLGINTPKIGKILDVGSGAAIFKYC